MNLNLSIEQLETVVTATRGQVTSATLKPPRGSRRRTTTCSSWPFAYLRRVIFERQMLLDQIIKTIESEVGLQAVHNDKLQRCELVNKSEEAE